MLLARADIRLLEEIGYDRAKFMRLDRLGFVKLQNARGYCVFYDVENSRCRVYKYRPLGCRIYPVIYSEEDGVIVDELCPQSETVSKKEISAKEKKLKKLLQRIDDEAEQRRGRV